MADDYEPFRRFLVSMLQGRPELVISQAADGAQAVQKAREVNPELILLDIGLPVMNGIEVARQIRKFSPTSKILFVSQETSVDVVEEAFAIGAPAYLVKADAGRELMLALDAVLRGEKYVSNTLGYDLTRAFETAPPDACGPAEWQEKKATPHHHEVGFYSDDRFLLDDFAQFAGMALKTGNAVIAIATEWHRAQLLIKLRADGLDMPSVIERGLYLSLDNGEAVSAFMAHDPTEPTAFFRLADNLVKRASIAANGDCSRVVVCGESAPLLWARGNADGAVRLEQLWDEVARVYGVRILCGYPLASFQESTGRDTFRRICSEHSAVVSR